MSYIVLARKYRPRHFDEVIGQEHITRVLKSAVASGRLAHAYLFCGPRGIGKTSCARILAKSLNCVTGPTIMPCEECASCREITQGNSFDVLEIDGASNRGIDEIRALRENVKFASGSGKYKIYIVDEVHMLTSEAFNALLKTLEEPPPHVKFVFATTDPNKVPSTIISRCQRYDFKRVGLNDIVATLTTISKKEGLKVDQDALYAIAKAAQGSLRDALSILDQVSAIADKAVQSQDVYSMLGLVDIEDLFRLTDEMAAGDCARTLAALESIIDKGKDIKQLNRDLLEHFRNIMVIKIGGKSLGRLVDYAVAIKEMFLAQSRRFKLSDIMKAIDLFIEAQDVARITESPRTALEIALAKFHASTAVLSEPDASLKRDVQEQADQIQVVKRAPKARLLNNQKGSIDISGPRPQPMKPEVKTDAADPQSPPVIAPDEKYIPVHDIAAIRQSWDALTSAVSRRKISLATYLQEGFPLELQKNRLTIGFTQEHEFHKSVLEEKGNILFVEEIFSGILRVPVRIEYRTMESKDSKPDIDFDENVQAVIKTFQGKVVNKWHEDV